MNFDMVFVQLFNLIKLCFVPRMVFLPDNCHIVTTRRLWNIRGTALTRLKPGDRVTLQHCGRGIHLKSPVTETFSSHRPHKTEPSSTQRGENGCQCWRFAVNLSYELQFKAIRYLTNTYSPMHRTL